MEGYRKCNFCGDYFVKSEDDLQRYCSEECHQKYLKKLRDRYVGKRQQNCAFCGKELPRNKTKYCSALCQRKDRDIRLGIVESHVELTKICPVCGEEFRTWKSKKVTCSEICSQRYHNSDRRLKGRIVDKDINLNALSKRDNNQCQICGLMVDWDDTRIQNKQIVYGRMYPSIDHIKPISLGGLHSWDNVQLAHIGCNTRKSNKYIG